MSAQAVTTLELDEKHGPRRYDCEWWLERSGMAMIGIIIASALLGLLGPGALNREVAVSVDGNLAAEHHWIQRNQASAVMLVRVRAPASKENVVRLHISRSFTDHVVMDEIVPQPVRVEMSDNDLVYHFLTSSAAADHAILFRFRHDEFGWIRYTLSMNQTTLRLKDFVWP